MFNQVYNSNKHEIMKLVIQNLTANEVQNFSILFRECVLRKWDAQCNEFLEQILGLSCIQQEKVCSLEKESLALAEQLQGQQKWGLPWQYKGVLSKDKRVRQESLQFYCKAIQSNFQQLLALANDICKLNIQFIQFYYESAFEHESFEVFLEILLSLYSFKPFLAQIQYDILV